MPRRAWLCLLLFCLPTALCGLMGIDSWPFSSFPMYSVPMSRRFDDYSLYLVTTDGSSYPVRERGCLWPLDAQRLSERVRFLQEQTDGAVRLQALLDYTGQRCLRYYKRRDPLLRPQWLELRSSRGSYTVTPQSTLERRVEQSEVVARVNLAPE